MEIKHCKKCRSNCRIIDHKKEMFIEKKYYSEKETLELMKKPNVKVVCVKECGKCREEPTIRSKLPSDLTKQLKNL